MSGYVARDVDLGAKTFYRSSGLPKFRNTSVRKVCHYQWVKGVRVQWDCPPAGLLLVEAFSETVTGLILEPDDKMVLSYLHIR